MKDFDLVISNPPYSITSKVLEEAMKHAETTVFIAPHSKITKLKKHCKKIDLQEQGCFLTEGADVMIPVIGVMDNKLHDQELDVMEPFVKQFIEEHSPIKFVTPQWVCKKYTSGNKVKLSDLNIDRDIVISIRLFDNNGFGRTENAVDYQFNIKRTIIKKYYGCTVIRCPNSKAKEIFADYLHSNPGFRSRLNGLHCTGSNFSWVKVVDPLVYNQIKYNS